MVNRNIFNSDNYRYLVSLLVPWALGFGLAMERDRQEGQGGAGRWRRRSALVLAGVMTADLARWYARFGWIDERGRPVRGRSVDPTLAWLDAHPGVSWIEGGYWDVYRLSFLTGGRVRGVPFPIYPNRFPEWRPPTDAGPGDLVVRPTPEGLAFRDAAIRAGPGSVQQGARGDDPVLALRARDGIRGRRGVSKPGTARSPGGRAGPVGPADLVAVLVWTAAIGFFFWDAVSFRKALFYFDITEINYPYRDFLAREIRLGRFSRWCPGLYCGLPLYSESQAGYLHPLKYLLYPWIATWKAFNLDTVLSVWLTGLGTYGWLRRHVGPAGALTGAAVFGLSGFVWAHLIHTSMNNALTSVPFIVWATEWAWDRGRLGGVVLGAVALACQVFAGHLQDTLLTAGLLGVYALFRAATERNGKARLAVLGVAAGVVALGVALSAVQWIPSKELLDRSPRAEGLTWDKLTYGSWAPELLPTLVVREAYGTRARDTDWMDGFYPYHEMNAYLGLIAMALAIVGGAASRDRWVGFWIILAGVGGILMLGKFTFLFDRAHLIPVLGRSRIPVRFHLWVSLAVAALAAVGVDRLARPGPVRLRGAAVLVLGLVLASVPILLYVYTPVWTEPGRWTTGPYPRRPLPMARPRAGVRGGPDVRPGPARRGRGGDRGAAGQPGAQGAARRDPAGPGDRRPPRGAHRRRPDHRPGILDRPPLERRKLEGRPDVRPPGFRPHLPQRAVGRRAGPRLGAGRFPVGPRPALLEPAAGLGPGLSTGRDPDHLATDGQVHRPRPARAGAGSTSRG